LNEVNHHVYGSTGMPAFRSRGSKTYTAQMGAILALKLLRSKPKYASKTKRKIAHVLCVSKRHYHRSNSCFIRILSHISAI
jgi:hypothetical protein